MKLKYFILLSRANIKCLNVCENIITKLYIFSSSNFP